jgi:hypothetical protein
MLRTGTVSSAVCAPLTKMFKSSYLLKVYICSIFLQECLDLPLKSLDFRGFRLFVFFPNNFNLITTCFSFMIHIFHIF